MRKVLALSFLLLSSLFAGEIVIHHSDADYTISKNNTYATISLIGQIDVARLADREGLPNLPQYIYRLPLTDAIDKNSITIQFKETLLPGNYDIPPLARPVTQEQTAKLPRPDDSVYGSNRLYPEQVAQFSGTGFLNGQAIASFIITPFRYNPQSKQLYLVSEIQINYAQQIATQEAVQPLRQSDTGTLNAIGKAAPRLATTDGLRPEEITAGSIDRYVIITRSDFVEALQPLARWKNEKGVPAVIRSLDWIQENFPQGVDLAEQIRNYLRWTYQMRGTKYVLLAGDTEIVPSRTIRTLWQGPVDYATDYYYADLDGNWNADQDAIFGEATDNVDGYPELYVSRIPVHNSDEIANYTEKLLRYEQFRGFDSTENYPANVLYTAGNIDRDNDGYDLITKHIDPQINPAFTRKMLTQDLDIGNDPTVVFNEMQKNYGLIFTESHGTAYTVQTGARNSNLYSYHMDALQNSMPALWYVASCYTNDIRKRSISESYVLNPQHGGIAYIGNSSYEFPASGVYLQKEFFDLVFNRGYFHQAEAHFLSRLIYLGYLNYEGPSRIIVYSTVVLGDPEMPIWTEKPKFTRVTVRDTTLQGLPYLAVNVQKADSGKQAVADARVVLYRQNQMHRLQYTDAAGFAYFEKNGSAIDSVSLTVVKHNLVPWQQTIHWQTSATAQPVLIGQQVDGGNGNQICEAGESLKLSLKIKNQGDSNLSSGLELRLLSPTPQVFCDSISTITPDIPAGQSSPWLGPFNLDIGANFTADTSLVLKAELRQDGQLLYALPVPFEIHLPQLQLLSSSIHTMTSDSQSTTSAVNLTLENSGMGDADSLQFSIVALDSGSTILQQPPMLQSLQAGAQVVLSEAFTVRHTQSADSLRFQLTIEDRFGRTRQQQLNFVAPLAVSQITFTPWDAHGIRLNWSPSASADVAGYYIWRAAAEEPFSLITPEMIDHAGYYIDEDISANGNYQYFVESVDSSGNSSVVYSDTISAWPALPFQHNFPQTIATPGIGGVANGVVTTDLTGNGKCEIIVSGANGVLDVFDARGSLLYSVQGMEGHLMTPAVGNVYGDSRNEIVVSAQFERQDHNWIYIVDADSGIVRASIHLMYNVPTAVVLADLDSDGLDEIIALTHSGNAPDPPKDTRLRIWKSTGSDWQSFSGWPEDGVSFGTAYGLGNPAVADIDRNGKIDIIVSANNLGMYRFEPADTSAPVWQKSASELAAGGTTGYTNTAVSLADLDGDGRLDILVPARKNDRLYALDPDGNPLPGWNGGVRIQTTDFYGYGAPAACGNLDEDVDPEIVCIGRDSVYVYEHDGQRKPGWPVEIGGGNSYIDHNYGTLSPYNSPVLADFNFDGRAEIVFVTTFGILHALDAESGMDITGFPIDTGNDLFQGQSPLIDDIERDGDLEVLLVDRDGILKVWDAPLNYGESNALYWNQPYGNIRHSGYADTTELQVISGLEEESASSVPDQFALEQNYPNPFNPETTIRYRLATAAMVKLKIFNVLGQEVATLVQKRQNRGVYSSRFNGQQLASGLYFVRLQAGDFVQTRKMMLLK